jgi:hypothetical protein
MGLLARIALCKRMFASGLLPSALAQTRLAHMIIKLVAEHPGNDALTQPYALGCSRSSRWMSRSRSLIPSLVKMR